MADAQDSDKIEWAALADDVLCSVLKHQALDGLLNAGAACKAWRAVAESNVLWERMGCLRWPEIAGLQEVSSYKNLFRRMAKADCRVALREVPGALQFMVRLRMEGTVVLAHTFSWADADEDGAWTSPTLQVPDAILQRAASDYAAHDLTCFRDFGEWFSSDVTVTVYRPLDGRIARLLPQTSPELPSEFCLDADYSSKITFTGFEERCANTSLVLGAQLACTGSLPDETQLAEYLQEGRQVDGCDSYDASTLEAFRSGLRLRLGYWPTTSFNDPERERIDWQSRFEASSSDKNGFATFVHCLLDGAAEYSWLHVS